MPLLMGGTATMMLENVRHLWIDGRVGGGKTALGVYMSWQLLRSKKVRYFVSNIPVVFADRVEDIQPIYHEDRMTLDMAVLLDEAGIFLKRQNDTEFMQFLRKLNVIFIMPSVKEVASNLRDLVIERSFNAQTIGLPFWIYSYYYRSRRGMEHAKFAWSNPSEIYGLYDTDAMPLDDAGISDLFDYWTPKAIEYYNQQKNKRIEGFQRHDKFTDGNKIPKSVRKVESSGGSDGSEYLEEALYKLEEFNQDLSISLERTKKKTRLRI